MEIICNLIFDEDIKKRKANDAEDDNGWRTTENGKHYQIDPSGNVIKGPTAMKGKNIKDPSTWKKSPSGGGGCFQ